MFADLGHFNPRSIQVDFMIFGLSFKIAVPFQLVFIFLFFVILVTDSFYIHNLPIFSSDLCGADLIKNPNDHNDGFYKFIPTPVYWPIFIIATLAAIVASQSLISATFSVIKQSVVLDYFPRVKIVHTSHNKEGEVYSPEVNYILMVLCVAVILIFGDGKDIGNAFGMTVSKTHCFSDI
jgi:KUP system potassium uptake protein